MNKLATANEVTKTILIVDDMPIVRDPIALMLRSVGYKTLTAANGIEAVKLLSTNTIDLVLLDVMMPMMDGIKFLERLRAYSSTAAIPVIMLTAEGERHEIVRAGQLGIQGYVLKSVFSLKDLLHRVQAQIGKLPTASSMPMDEASAALAATPKDASSLPVNTKLANA